MAASMMPACRPSFLPSSNVAALLRNSRFRDRNRLGGVEPGEQSVFRKFESFLHDEGGVGVIDEVVFGDAIVLDRVVDQAAEKGDVSAGANLQEEIG